jgi:hypothetical protein
MVYVTTIVSIPAQAAHEVLASLSSCNRRQFYSYPSTRSQRIIVHDKTRPLACYLLGAYSASILQTRYPHYYRDNQRRSTWFLSSFSLAKCFMNARMRSRKRTYSQDYVSSQTRSVPCVRLWLTASYAELFTRLRIPSRHSKRQTLS